MWLNIKSLRYLKWVRIINNEDFKEVGIGRGIRRKEGEGGEDSDGGGDWYD